MMNNIAYVCLQAAFVALAVSVCAWSFLGVNIIQVVQRAWHWVTGSKEGE